MSVWVQVSVGRQVSVREQGLAQSLLKGLDHQGPRQVNLQNVLP